MSRDRKIWLKRKIIGIILSFNKISYLCLMEDKGLLMLARIVLPKEVLDNFLITDIEYVDTKAYDEPELHIHLDEKMHPDLQGDSFFESKSFISPVEVTDFPIRDHKVVLVCVVADGWTRARVRVSSFR